MRDAGETAAFMQGGFSPSEIFRQIINCLFQEKFNIQSKY